MRGAHYEHCRTCEDHHQQAGGLQLHVGVAEGVAEGGVDDDEEDEAAHRPEGKLTALQTLPQKPPAQLHKHN